MKKTLEQIRIGAAVIDCAGRIVEVSEGWPALARKRGNSASLVGRSYFDLFIRPDRHSLDLLRGLKNLAERSIDFFATINWREEAGERRYFLIAAVLRPHAPDRILVLHIDLAALLRARDDLSALMIGHGSAARAQMESEGLGLVRDAIVEALAKPNGRSFPGATVDGPAEQRLLNELTRPQIELLSCLADGLSNRQIARLRRMSINTVKSQVAGLIRKLDVANRTQAALFAVRHGTALGLNARQAGRK